MPVIRFADVRPDQASAVGGKGWNLAHMAQAGLTIPDGFCLPTDVFADAEEGRLPEALLRDVARAYEQLGGGTVAVRSSAAAEDGAEASFAGQQETILGVVGPEALAEAVDRCWTSWRSRRAEAYRARQGMSAAGGMAVVVQRLVEAESAGVLFTQDPTDATGTRMLVEAAWGLGEAVVSGRLTPDRFQIERATGAVHASAVASKPFEITSSGERALPPDRAAAPSLSPEQLVTLAAAGRQIEALYGGARDVEWAFADGRLWILQARPITTAGAFERETVRHEEMARCRALAAPGGTVWARYNLAEVLPAPTPLTWDVVRWFMSGRGGLGAMYRDLGFDPDPLLDEFGIQDLICGRPYVNLSREPQLFFRDFPYGHDFAALKAEPQKAIYPQPRVDGHAATGRMWWRLPAIIYRMFRSQRRVAQQMRTHAARLSDELFPAFRERVAAAQRQDVSTAEPADLLAQFDEWTQRTLHDFARESLKPSLFAATALGTLEAALVARLGPDAGPAAARSGVMGVRPPPEADLARALAELAAGRRSLAEFLADFGHRGPREMELAEPRWAESSTQLATSGAALPETSDDPDGAWRAVELPADVRAAVEPDRQTARTYLGLRESAKHHLMLGYGVMRRLLVELDRRLQLNGGIFYLRRAELPRLAAGEDLSRVIAARHVIAARQWRRRIELSLPAPAVLFSDDLEALGRPPEAAAGSELTGTAVSAGVAEGPALVLTDPHAAADVPDGFILVCPSTDPAWVPLFLRAAGLVMETGGILSHGAIVAREFHLPAVVGLPHATTQITTGQRLQVDGHSGKVTIL